MTTSLPPPVSHPPAPSPTVTGPAPRPRRRRWWIITGIIAACLLGVGIAGIGLNWAMDVVDTYSADLTTGSGAFRTFDNADAATFYRADGYHLVDKTPGFVTGGVTTDFTHTALAAKVTVRAVTAPPGTAFGPWVIASQTNRVGYWLSVDSAGTATLNEWDAGGDVRVVASAKAPPLGAGTTRTLMLTCVIDLDRSVHLGGYVDGTRVVSGAPTVKISGVTVTGMAGYAEASVPAEWVATQFTRVSSHDLPKDVNGASASEPSAPATTAAPATVSGKLGDTATVTDMDGNSYRVQLTVITDPASGATEFDTPKSGTRFVGLTFKVTSVSARINDSVLNCASLRGSDGQIYRPSIAGLAGEFPVGMLNLNSGESATGTIPFEVPDGVKVTSVKWVPNSGYADSAATWSIG